MAGLFVLGLSVTESLSRGYELPQFSTHHIFNHFKCHIFFTVMNLELQTHELRQNGCCSGVRSDGSTF